MSPQETEEGATEWHASTISHPVVQGCLPKPKRAHHTKFTRTQTNRVSTTTLLPWPVRCGLVGLLLLRYRKWASESIGYVRSGVSDHQGAIWSLEQSHTYSVKCHDPVRGLRISVPSLLVLSVVNIYLQLQCKHLDMVLLCSAQTEHPSTTAQSPNDQNLACLCPIFRITLQLHWLWLMLLCVQYAQPFG